MTDNTPVDLRFRPPALPWRQRDLLAACLAWPVAASLAIFAAAPALKYNHDVDIVKVRGRFFAAWNASEARAEEVRLHRDALVIE